MSQSPSTPRTPKAESRASQESASSSQVPTSPVPSSVQARKFGPRLAIHSLVLEDFKSYAGKQVIGPFHRSFSAVVGPNGSGKSNVMDGILFVFGKQAKKLRLNRVSELIHHSEEHPNLKSCMVTVNFYDVVPNVRAQSIVAGSISVRDSPL